MHLETFSYVKKHHAVISSEARNLSSFFQEPKISARNANFEGKIASRSLLQGALDERQATLGLFAHQFFAVAAISLNAMKLIGNRQRRQHGDLLRVHGGSARGNGVHFFVNERRQLVDVRFVQFAANRVRLSENLNFYGTAHGFLAVIALAQRYHTRRGTIYRARLAASRIWMGHYAGGC